MTKKHIANKLFADLHFKLPKEYQRKLVEHCEAQGYDPSVMTRKEIMLKVIDLALSNDGVETLETEPLDEEEYFDCHKLCKKERTCTSNAMFDLKEIKALNCYVSKYPYEWTTPDGRDVRVCKFMVFSRGFPHDEENPYPKCVAKQKDIIVQLPRDRIMRNPEIC